MSGQLTQDEDLPRSQQIVLDVGGLFREDHTVQSLLASLAEGLIVIDSSGVIVLVNRRTEEMFGYRRNELVGRSLSMLLPERFAGIHSKHVSDYFDKPRLRPMGQGLELIGRCKDGRELPVDVSLSFVNAKEGLLGLALVTDVTLRKQAEMELKRRNEELDAFAHTVAHDLNSPLALIVGLSEALVETHGTLSEQERHDLLMIIARNARRMSNIISELLLFASVRKDEVDLRPLDMAQIVHEAVQRLRHMVDEYQAQITQPEYYPQARGYAAWVGEVWFNYISNGIKYGGRPPRLELGATVQEDGYVRFWVKDNGAGLTMEQQAKMFVAFTQLDQLRVEGHGLGLSIVRRIVEKLNGEVSVESQVGNGSTFSFTLPAVE